MSYGIRMDHPGLLRRTTLDDMGFWSGSAERRVKTMRAGKLSIAQCLAWASRAPHEVPIVNNEFEFLAMSTPEACGD